MLGESTTVIVALLVFSEYDEPAAEGQYRLDSLPHSAKQQNRLRNLFQTQPYRDAGFQVLDLEPGRDSSDVLTKLKQIGDLVQARAGISVVLIWSGHGFTDVRRRLRLATPECAAPLDDRAGVAAAEIVVQSGATAARNFCVFIDACEAGGSALEFAEVAGARSWNDSDKEHSFAAFYASHPYEKAKDGVYLSLLASILENGPSQRAEAMAKEEGHFCFNEKNRLLSAADVEEGIAAEIRANPSLAEGVSIPEATKLGRQILFPNPRFRLNAPARMVDQKARDTHFLPKARGVEFNERGWHFTGRAQATQDILRWAASGRGSVPNTYVLTGSGGTGKSAIVGRLVALANADLREGLRAEGWNEAHDRALGAVPADGLFAAAVHLRNLAAQHTVEQLAELLGFARPETPEGFVEQAAKLSMVGTLIVFDALDEAEDPRAVALRVIRPLAELGWRALVATRRTASMRGADNLIGLLSSASVRQYDLDADMQSQQDIAAYVRDRIRASHSPQFADNSDLIELASTKIAERADFKFLYARLATSNLLRCVDEISELTLDALLGNDTSDVFAQDLISLDRAFQLAFKRKDRGATRILEALAWARGNGIPIRDGLWTTIASAVASTSGPSPRAQLEDAHVRWVLREAGRYILEDGDGDQAVYRLFHQSLIEFFHPQSDVGSATADAVAAALTHRLGEMGGWPLANSYLVRYMAAYWAACRPQTELHALLVEFAWIQTRLKLSGVTELLKDYQYADDPTPVVTRVARTLSMTAHILRKDAQQLIPQLLGRLRPEDERTQRLCDEARQAALERPMLLPRCCGLTEAGALIRVIESGFVHSVAFSPDGTRLVTGGLDHAVRLWDRHSGEPVGAPLLGHSSDVYCVAFSPDGTRVVSCGDDQTVRLWDVRSAEALGEPLLGHSGTVCSVAFSPDGTRAVSAGRMDHKVRLWDAHRGQALGEPLVHHGGVHSVAFSPDGTRIVSGGRDGTVRLWDAYSLALGELLNGDDGDIYSVAFSPGGTHVLSGSKNGTVRLWDARITQVLSKPLQGHDKSVRSVAFSPDGMQIVSGGDDGTVRLWDARSGLQLGDPLLGNDCKVCSVAFSPDGTCIASGGVDQVRLWDVHHIQVPSEPTQRNDNWITAVAYSPDGTRVVSGSLDGTLLLWDACSGEALGDPWHGHNMLVYGVAFSPDGSQIVSGSDDGTVRLWDARSGLQLGDPLLGNDGKVYSVAFSPEGNRVVSAGKDGTVRLWDVCSGEAVGKPLSGHSGGAFCVAFSPDGERVVSGGWDGTLRLWDALNGQALGKPLRGHCFRVLSVAFSADGTQVMSSGEGDGTVLRWDVCGGKALHKTRHEPLLGQEGSLFSFAFSADGNCMVSGSNNGVVRLYDTDTGRCLAAINVDCAPISVAVSPCMPLRRVSAAQHSSRPVFLDLVLPID